MNVHSPLSCLAATLMAATALPAQRAVRPDRLVIEPPTLHCVSVQYHLRGDENENATCAVQYRRPGDSAWREAQPLLRVSRGENAQYKVSHGNMLAGSVFWLEPDTPYELRLTLRDPDGGGEERAVAVRTRGEPRAAADARQILVQPDTIAPALENARAGDVFVLQPGRYGSLRISRDGADGRPIVLRGANRDQVTIVGTLTLSERQHVILEDLDVQGHIVAHRGRDLAVKRCRIRVTERKPNIHGIGDCRNYYIADNELLGSGEWSNEQRAGSDGVKLSGSGHVICHNLIRDHWDNISLYTIDDQKKPGGFPCMAVDIYGNDFFGGRDDGIEADYQHHNIRIFRNRFTNTGSTISFQPMYGGPGYVLYNEIYNSRIKPYKFHVGPSGMIVYHNTSISSWNGWSGGNPDNSGGEEQPDLRESAFHRGGSGQRRNRGYEGDRRLQWLQCARRRVQRVVFKGPDRPVAGRAPDMGFRGAWRRARSRHLSAGGVPGARPLVPRELR